MRPPPTLPPSPRGRGRRQSDRRAEHFAGTVDALTHTYGRRARRFRTCVSGDVLAEAGAQADTGAEEQGRLQTAAPPHIGSQRRVVRQPRRPDRLQNKT
eukprot:8675464-Pyramimonas_sp.AAC.1